MHPVFVVDAVRTPIGKYGGALSTVRPDDLLALTIKAILQRNPRVPPEAIEEVIAGAANQAGEDNRNVARMAALLAGLPVTVAGVTVNRLCASGLQAILDGARALALGQGEIILAGGVESMTRAPFVQAKQSAAWGRQVEVFDSTLGWRFVNPALAARYPPMSMGETAEKVAREWGISREDQDRFAIESQQKYGAADEAGRFEDELIPVPVTGKKGVEWLMKDEHPRKVSLEQLAGLPPAFEKAGTVTAGNSSGINDGAAMVLLASENALKKYQLTPMAELGMAAVAGVDPSVMGIGPVPAVQKLLARAGLSVKDLDLVELNEAFAAQSLACIRDLGLDPQKVNVNGGAIALGHPLGCSGARLVTTLVHEMVKREAVNGLATMCVGVGQGVALLLHRKLI